MIYADHAATTAMDEAAIAELLRCSKELYGNPSSLYLPGRLAKDELQKARGVIARSIGADADEIYFTSGGTESDNWAIKSVALSSMQRGRGRHIITTSIEHHAVLRSCASLETQGFEMTYLPVDGSGKASLSDLERAIRPDTCLISMMYGNNEIGTLQPIEGAALLAKERGIPFHCDAVQAVGHTAIQVKELGVSLLSASGHKFHGPKGVGFLYASRELPLSPWMDGGNQEKGKRAGTESVANAAAMAAALAQSLCHLEQNAAHQRNLANTLRENLRNQIPGIRFHGDEIDSLPGIVSISLPNTTASEALVFLDSRGIFVSAGSACNAGSTSVSHVLRAIGLSQQEAKSTIRVSFDKNNTLAEVAVLAQALKEVCQMAKTR